MGRSPRFCFSIKACAGAPTDDGDKSIVHESKPSPEKRRWSLRKKSVDHHAPNNTNISEHLPVFSENQYQESTADTFYSEEASPDPDKAYVVERTSSTLLSAVVSSEVQTELTSIATVGVDYGIPEHAVIAIQTSIRRCLAKKELLKLKNVLKLQAVARGYLVRKQAAGTLRCIQAIVKMQALVRARRSVQLAGLVEKQSDMEQSETSSAIRKSDSSAFARQLLESTPKTKPIYISCDPLRPDSAWNWLERWMTLTSTSQQNLIIGQNDLGKEMKADLAAYDVDVRLHFIHGHASSHSELTANSQEVPEFEGDLITNISKRVELSPPACISDQFSTSLVQESSDMENDEDWSKREAKEGSVFFSNQMQQPLDASLHSELDLNPSKSGFAENNFKDSGRKELNEAPEIEGNAANGSRKLSNPAFAAVQAKFEELSSVPASNRYSDHPSRDVIGLSKSTIVNFTSNEVSASRTVQSKRDSKLKEVDLNEKPSKPNPEGQVAPSDYVTEISISSPDRPDAVISAIAPKMRTPIGVKSVIDVSLKLEEMNTEAEKNRAISVDSVEGMQVQKQSSEPTVSSIKTQEEGTEDKKIYRRPQNGSPRSYTDFSDSPMTPSSQKSPRVRNVKVENSFSARKKRPQLAVKNSSISPKSDSGARGSGEHLWNGAKSVKRPSSSGNDRANHIGHEDGSSSLPSYMQLTESAKAKINASISHKLNIGLHHEDNYIKKRYSLPIGNGKQGASPWVQSSTSQTQQALKGNGVSSHNSTERRWQI